MTMYTRHNYSLVFILECICGNSFEIILIVGLANNVVKTLFFIISAFIKNVCFYGIESLLFYLQLDDILRYP